MSQIREVSNEQANSIIATRVPLGLFYTVKQTIGERPYLGIDNSTGDAWTEDFYNLDECIHWLSSDE
jgi:hypothetical protein